MGLTLTTPASTYPVTLAEAAAQCKLEVGEDDVVLQGLIAAATDYVEQYLGRSLMAQSWALRLDAFADEMLLERGPVSAVSSVKYQDTNDVQQTLATSIYAADLVSDPARIVRKPNVSWPAIAAGINGVIITYTAGYVSVPAAIKHAILLLIAQWYDNRSPIADRATAELPNAVTSLLCNFRSF